MKYVAFLRAINITGRYVKMDQIRSAFESLRFEDVQTVIASGNVIFDTSAAGDRALEAKIENALQRVLGFEVTTFVRSVEQLRAIAKHQPFKSSKGILSVAFLPSKPSVAAFQKLVSLRTADEQFATREREIYWFRTRKMSEGPLTGTSLEKIIGLPATVRNITTVERIVEKCA